MSDDPKGPHDPAAALKRMQDGLRDGTMKLELPATATPENFPRRGPKRPGDGEVTATSVSYGVHHLTMRYGIRGVGFGEITIAAFADEDGITSLQVDTEMMDAETVAKVICHAADELAKALVNIDHADDQPR